MNDVDVIVVGAGLAGLRAAERLREGGASVRVLEARDRVGGRTVSQDIGGVRFDLGAQWTGPGQERVAALIKRLGLHTHPQHVAGRKVLEVQGKVSTYKRSIPSLSTMHLLELERTIRRVDRMTARIDPDDPLSSPGAPGWDAQTVETYKHSILSSKVRGLVDAMVRVVFGSEASELSLLYFLYYLRLGGGLMRLVETRGGAQETLLVGGMPQLAEGMAAGLGDDVQLNAPVARIVQDGEGVHVTTHGPFLEPRGDTPPTSKLARGGQRRIRARRVIVAVPPAVAGIIDYWPLLPSRRDQITSRMPMGATMKCIALYERPFWRAAGFSGEVVCDGLPISVVFDDCTHDGSAFALLGFAVGRGARILGELSEVERKRAVTDCFVRWFGEEARNCIGYGDLDWSREAWTRGCPTGVLQPGAFSIAGRALREPVGRVHWAGTETARVWTGFMEGALESGERAAAEVLERL